MPQLLPFTGLRPRTDVVGSLDNVICPPYDVITDEQRSQLAARSPYNAVTVELPNGDYDAAARQLAGWREDGAFTLEAQPALYGYRMTYRGLNGQQRETLGVMGALVLEPPGHGILPHEQTTPKAKSDRLDLIRATHANTSPIWCLCGEPGLAGLLEHASPGGLDLAPAKAVDDEGTEHELWPITDPDAISAIAAVIAAGPLLVADGHHRYETALAYQAECETSGRQAAPAGCGAALTLVVELSDEHLDVQAIHRAVSGLADETALLSALAEQFELTGTTSPAHELLGDMVSTNALGLITKDGNWLAVPKPGGLADGYELDSSRADAVLGTLPAHRMSYEHDVPQGEADVRSGKLQAMVLCRPATVGQIARTAQGGSRMPPKTTFFWPKPRTGMVFRLLG